MAHGASCSPQSRPERWWSNYREAAQWVASFGRLPRHNSRRAEQSREDAIARFLSKQRRRTDLDAEQLAALQDLHTFSFDPRFDAFARRAREYGAFLQAESRVPSRNRSRPSTERSLAEWRRRALAAAARGDLSYGRIALLREYHLL